jgi:cell division protein DivIC
MSNVSKKKSLKYAKRRMCLLTFLLVALIIGGIGSVFSDWMKIYENRHEYITLSNQYQDLENQSAQLKSDVNKLQDPDYVARYAREKYLYTKDGELIIRIPKSSSENK